MVIVLYREDSELDLSTTLRSSLLAYRVLGERSPIFKAAMFLLQMWMTCGCMHAKMDFEVAVYPAE